MRKQVIKLDENVLRNVVYSTIKNILMENDTSVQCQNESTVDAHVNGTPYTDYTHFAVKKDTGLIVNGWDYNGYDGSDLRANKKYYFIDDLIDNEFDPKEFVILTRKSCERRGINPDDMQNCWSNRGDLPLCKEKVLN